MTRALLTSTYLLFSATVGIAVYLFTGASTGFLVGVVLALGCFQIHANARNRRARRITQGAIASLHRRLEQALDETRAQIDVVNKVVDSRAAEQNRKIMTELQLLENLMRGFADGTSENDEPSAATTSSNSAAKTRDEMSDEPELLRTIRDTIEQSRVDLYLQPIVSLPQRKLRFYEALSRLRTEEGSVIMPAQYIKLAAPAGLMSVVDQLLLFRCVQIVRRLMQKQRDIGIFCNISGVSLIDAEFFPQFLEFMHANRDLAGQIVCELSQEDVKCAGAEGEANLASLARLGFALSLDRVESWEFDFTKLRTLGFRYIKVRAAMLIQENAVVNMKKLCERHGLNLIVERVEDEGTVRQLLDFGVDCAQGYLFGGPRAVRDDSLRVMEMDALTTIPFRKAG